MKSNMKSDRIVWLIGDEEKDVVFVFVPERPDAQKNRSQR